MWIVFCRDISLVLQTREISLRKNNSHDLHRVIRHSLVPVVVSGAWTVYTYPESQGKPGKKVVRELFFISLESQGKLGKKWSGNYFLFLQKFRELFFQMLIVMKIKNSWFSFEKYHDYHFMLQVKLLSKCLKLSGKFVFRSGKKSGNIFYKKIRYLLIEHITTSPVRSYKSHFILYDYIFGTAIT